MRPASEIAPRSAPSEAIFTGSGNPLMRSMPSAARCARHASLSAKRRCRCEARDHFPRQLHSPHVAECGIIDGAGLFARAEMLEKVETALRAGRSEMGEEIAADHRAVAVRRPVAGPMAFGFSVALRPRNFFSAHRVDFPEKNGKPQFFFPKGVDILSQIRILAPNHFRGEAWIHESRS